MQWSVKTDAKGKEHCRLVVSEELSAIVYWTPGWAPDDEAGWAFMINGTIDPLKRVFPTAKMARVAALFRLVDLTCTWAAEIHEFTQQKEVTEVE